VKLVQARFVCGVCLGLLTQFRIFQEVCDGKGQRLAVVVGTAAIRPDTRCKFNAMVGRIQFERLAVALGERILSVLAD
jgi:hypothetical protein